jgi:hypothetical protein
MQSRRVERLPVIEDSFRPCGIVSQTDVLSASERPDSEIRDELVKGVITGEFGLDPELLVVTVRSGVVTITGSVERRADALGLLGAIPLPGRRRGGARPSQLPARGLRLLQGGTSPAHAGPTPRPAGRPLPRC